MSRIDSSGTTSMQFEPITGQEPETEAAPQSPTWTATDWASPGHDEVVDASGENGAAPGAGAFETGAKVAAAGTEAALRDVGSKLSAFGAAAQDTAKKLDDAGAAVVAEAKTQAGEAASAAVHAGEALCDRGAALGEHAAAIGNATAGAIAGDPARLDEAKTELDASKQDLTQARQQLSDARNALADVGEVSPQTLAKLDAAEAATRGSAEKAFTAGAALGAIPVETAAAADAGARAGANRAVNEGADAVLNAVQLGDQLRALQPGDSLTASQEVVAKVEAGAGEKATLQVTRGDDGRYTLSASVEDKLLLAPAAGVTLGSKAAQGKVEVSQGFAGSEQFKFATADEAERGARVYAQLAASVGAAIATAILGGSAQAALTTGVSDADLAFLRDHATSIQLGGTNGLKLSAELKASDMAKLVPSLGATAIASCSVKLDHGQPTALSVTQLLKTEVKAPLRLGKDAYLQQGPGAGTLELSQTTTMALPRGTTLGDIGPGFVSAHAAELAASAKSEVDLHVVVSEDVNSPSALRRGYELRAAVDPDALHLDVPALADQLTRGNVDGVMRAVDPSGKLAVRSFQDVGVGASGGGTVNGVGVQFTVEASRRSSAPL